MQHDQEGHRKRHRLKDWLQIDKDIFQDGRVVTIRQSFASL